MNQTTCFKLSIGTWHVACTYRVRSRQHVGKVVFKVRNVVTWGGFILTIVNNDIMLTYASFSFKFSNEIAFFGLCHSVKHSASLFAWFVGIFKFF